MRTDFEQEVMDRIVRIESRVVQLGDHVGANLRTKQKIDIRQAGGRVTIEIDSLDVSLSRILTQLAQTTLLAAGGKGADIPVYHGDRFVMTVRP